GGVGADQDRDRGDARIRVLNGVGRHAAILACGWGHGTISRDGRDKACRPVNAGRRPGATGREGCRAKIPGDAMRILMLTQSYAPIVGGVERVVEDLSSELTRRGHEVGVATLRQPGKDAGDADAGIAVHGLGTATYRLPGVRLDTERRHAPPLPDPETALQLRRLIRRERPDVVHAHNWLVHSRLPLDRRAGPALALSMHDYGLICSTKRFFHQGAPCSGPGIAKCIRCAG